MDIPKAYIRKYWFGIEDSKELADVVLLMEKDRIEQYKAALDLTTNHFAGVFKGVTGIINKHRVSIIYSIGPAHIADCVNFLAYGFQVKLLFATGSVGGLNSDIGDIILANSCATQDGYALYRHQNQIQRTDQLGQFVLLEAHSTLELEERTINEVSKLFNCTIRKGKVFTVPCVSIEDKAVLQAIQKEGYLALDLETGPFLAACKHSGVLGIAIHWVTDLPLTKNFYYPFFGEQEEIQKDQRKKHRQWLNMPSVILPILVDLLEKNEPLL